MGAGHARSRYLNRKEGDAEGSNFLLALKHGPKERGRPNKVAVKAKKKMPKKIHFSF
jgi:hypothetical protein